MSHGQKLKAAAVTLCVLVIGQAGVSRVYAADALPSASTLAKQGHALQLAHKDSDALPILLQALKLDPKNADAYIDLGVVYERLGQAEKALAAYQQSAHVHPSSHALRNVGITLLGMKHNQDGEAALKEAIRLDPMDLGSYSALARFYSMSGRDQEASSMNQRAVRIPPTALAIDYLQRGRAFRTLGLGESALADFNEALQLDPSNSDVLDECGFSNLILGRGDAAAANSTKSLKLRNGNTVDAIYPTLVGYFGSRMAGNDAAAASFLKQAEVKGDSKGWPFPVVRYLRHELSESEVLALATDNSDSTEAHTYIGLDLALSGHTDQAMPYLRWVQQHGVHAYAEYQLAQAEIARLEQPAAAAK